MSATETIREQTVELPAAAPMIRITAGFGSAGQKTWNLRRPITVIGSRRPAHIVLHDAEVSNPHCVIINSGTDVLIKDLHTSSGTWLNKERINLATLKDGDVVTLGSTNIQIAIQTQENGAADDSGAGLEFSDPLKFPAGLRMQLLHTEKFWDIEDSVVMLGRHDDAGVRLDHQDISARHVVLFRFGHSPALFDLGSRSGLWVNGQRCSLTTVHDGDRVTLGPYALLVHADGSGAVPGAGHPASGAISTVPPMPLERPFASPPPEPIEQRVQPSIPVTPPPSPTVAVEPPVPPLHGHISAAWERLNNWRTQLREGTPPAASAQDNPGAREAELEARDAAIRGQLHDVAQFHEELLVREREVAARAAQVQAEADLLLAGKTEAVQREAEFARRDQELQRREHAIAQRWSRLSATTCPHCEKPINVVQTDPS